MIQLLIADSAPNEQNFATRFGGRPLVTAPRDFEWPHCNMKFPMQFLGQLSLLGGDDEPKLALLFMCDCDENCSTWEADSGANRVLIVGGQSLELCEPPVPAALRPTMYGARIELWPGDSYDDARLGWGAANDGGRTWQVLGKIGGPPVWIQGDDTPSCACGQTMEFVAQLETGPDEATEMNFGGGCAYLFRCGDHAAKLLWQQ